MLHEFVDSCYQCHVTATLSCNDPVDALSPWSPAVGPTRGRRPPPPLSSPVSTNLRIISYAVVLGIRSSAAVSRKSSPASYQVINPLRSSSDTRGYHLRGIAGCFRSVPDLL
ncbi:hypothetical protein Hamer_G005929 [Homarus americanus]|uniref:Uncharacterized protein n=1 Tax=Homarus americanus TaxID=6706 RepID=A0A8J5JHV4_HOMAM|nr:hypothetical protein Hamer_G005929 [Homarus americanus]